jgi:hypothetical protein
MAFKSQRLHKKHEQSTDCSMAQFSISHEVRLDEDESQIALNGLAEHTMPLIKTCRQQLLCQPDGHIQCSI